MDFAQAKGILHEFSMAIPLKLLGFAALLLPGWAEAQGVIHHRLQVALQPDAGSLQVTDTISVPPQAKSLRFSLHPGLAPHSPDPAVRIEEDNVSDPFRTLYRLIVPPGRNEVTVEYGGRIAHPLRETATGITRDQQGTPGLIAQDNVYLDGNSRWYPQFDDALATFNLNVALPPAWTSVSQGRHATGQDHQDSWEETHPQEEIYLLAAPFKSYHQSSGGIDTAVLLRAADPDLAQQYLAVMGEYLAMYGRLLGPYPYAKFYVVENRWESGYGMPSFTLLGSQVMRLPFILRSSLPHEILHNWWGNGVYVDYSQGNWSEGLTAYLADHLLQEQVGRGAEYRRNALLRYTNYVSEGDDFPLKDFQGRHSEASQAVGYDKALMLFHMLRMQLGDQIFTAALRALYKERQFKITGWDQVRQAFEATAHRSLRNEFQQWLERRGAPVLALRVANATVEGEGYELTLELEQTQGDPPYHLRIPIAVQLDGRDLAWQSTLDMTHTKQRFQIAVPARPWRVQVDPQFDVFRRLDPRELPPTLSEALGAESLLMVLPAGAPQQNRDAYQRLAQTWSESAGGIEIRWDKDLQALPAGRAVWLLGWENRFLGSVAEDKASQMKLTEGKATVGDQSLNRKGHSVVLVARHQGAVLAWLGCDNPAAIPGLARKLPHYGSYSYLAFQGDAPTNFLKGQWRVQDSPLSLVVQQNDKVSPSDVPLRLSPRAALVSHD